MAMKMVITISKTKPERKQTGETKFKQQNINV